MEKVMRAIDVDKLEWFQVNLSNGETCILIRKPHIDELPIIDAEPIRNGCEYCSGDKAEYQSTPYAKLDIETILDKKSLVVECSICPPYTDCCMKCTPVRSLFKINYCPNCGAKMT